MLQNQAVEPNTLELLTSLASKKYLEHFFLVGGTALALQIGHRLSVDLDFFTNSEFDTDLLTSELLNDYELLVLQKTKGALIAKVNGIKVDFIHFRYPLLNPLIIEGDIRIASIEDIGAMKLDAITARGSRKDFFDLYFLLQIFDLNTLLGFYSAKYPHQTTFYVVRSISYFDDAELQPEPLVFDKKITWTKVKKVIAENIRSI